MGSIARRATPATHHECNVDRFDHPTQPQARSQHPTLVPRDRVIQSLEKYKVPLTEWESSEDLCSRLADFYAQRT